MGSRFGYGVVIALAAAPVKGWELQWKFKGVTYRRYPAPGKSTLVSPLTGNTLPVCESLRHCYYC